MTSPVSGVPLVAQNVVLSSQQKNIVRSMYLVSLGVCLTSMGLFVSSAGFSNLDLKNSHNMLISSLRFPCLVFGASLLICAEFAAKYFKQMNEMQREGPHFLIQEINKQLAERVHLTPSEN